MLIVLLCLFAATPKVGGMTPDVRSGSVAWITGEGFAKASLRVDARITTTADNHRAEIAEAINTGMTEENPPVAWDQVGTAVSIASNPDGTVAGITPPIEQGFPYSIPFRLTNGDGPSPTYVLNKPTIYGIAGADPLRLYQGGLYVLVGRHLSATNAEPTLWAWNGKKPVDPSSLISIPLLTPGGRGTGETRDLRRSAAWFTIPPSFSPGDYYLLLSLGENRVGITRATGLRAKVLGPDPWTTAKPIDINAKSGDDITDLLTMWKGKGEDNPLVFRLPPGVFTISKPIDWPANVGLIGSGMYATRVVASRDLVADPSKMVLNRSAMIRLTGSNVRFADLSLEASPDPVGPSPHAILAAATGVDRVVLDRVRLASDRAVSDHNQPFGVIFRYGLHRYWRLSRCLYQCQRVYEATNGPLNTYRVNGSFDFGLIDGGRFESVYGPLTGSQFGPMMGRGCLLSGVEFVGVRRGFAFSPGDGCLESVFSQCRFTGPSEYGNGETILTEARGGGVARIASANLSSFTIDRDGTDRQRWTVYVLSGKGAGQFRVIYWSAPATPENDNRGTHLLESPWEIVPDTSSTVLLVQAPTRCSFVGNRFTDTIGGVTLYGSSFGTVIAGNGFRATNEGITINTNWNTAGTSGDFGQKGDGRSAAAYVAIRGNEFGSGAGIHLIAARTSADFQTFTAPQITCVSTSLNVSRGDVAHQLWAGEGVEQKADTAGPNLAANPIISFVSSNYDRTYTDPGKYLHRALSRAALRRPIWNRTPAGISGFGVFRHSLDDVEMQTGDPNLIGVSP